ncbi:MAG: leucine-rich repeat protein [Clostridia bacterium]|nr:leucine-rich repeat protein [Clostridia bacterium]
MTATSFKIKKGVLFALALGIIVSMFPAAFAANDGLSGANIQDGQLLGYYGDGGDIVIPDTVTMIAPEAFKENDNVTSVTIPGSVSVIGYNAFEGCTALERVIFADPVNGADMIIRVSAFIDCPKLYDIEIPATAVYVTANIFKNCTSLEKIKVHPDNPYYFTDDEGVLFGPWVDEGEPQYDDPNLALIAYPCGKASGGYTIPMQVSGRTVNRVWASGFRDAKNLTSVEIPETLSILGANAFENTGLREVVIPETVTKIDSAVFEGCTELTDVMLPSTITSIPARFFYGCTSLARINMPDSIRTFEMYAFKDCKSLTSLIMPSNLSSITLATFDGCDNLQRVVIPASVINFPSDEYVGMYDPFPDSPRSLIVYVEKGSAGEKWAYNYVDDWGYTYEILDDTSDLTLIEPNEFYLIDLNKKVKVSGTFPITATLTITPVYSGSEYDVFAKAAGAGSLCVYELSLLPAGTDASDELTLSIGLPDGYTKSAKLYQLEGGVPVALSASVVSKTLTAKTDCLGYVAVIDSTVEGGNDDEITKVTLNKSSASIKVGEKIQLSAAVSPSASANKSITWESSDSAIASVDTKGVVTANKAGSTDITATAVNGVNAICKITVTDSSGVPPVSTDTIETKAALTAGKKAGDQGETSFLLSLSEASRIATVHVTFQTASETMKISGKNGFTLIGDVKKGASNTYTAVLGCLTSDKSLFSCTDSTEIAEILTDTAETSLKITAITLAGWDSDETVAYGTVNELSPDEAVFTGAPDYDVNSDGVVDLLDIAEAQLYYRADSDSSDWSEAKKCDFNGDNMIDVEDYIEIWLNFSNN